MIKRFIPIGAQAVPGLQISEAVTETITVPVKVNGEVVLDENGQPKTKNILAQFADIYSIRETNPANGPVQQYPTVSRENLRFTPLRFSTVVGLDIDEHGAALDLAVLEARRMDNIMSRQAARVAANIVPVVSLDDESTEGAPA